MPVYKIEIAVIDTQNNKIDSVQSEVGWLNVDDARAYQKALFLIFTNLVTQKLSTKGSKEEPTKRSFFKKLWTKRDSK